MTLTAKLVRYELEDGVALLALDDGKRNALSPAMFDAIYAALARAEREATAVVLSGREGIFSAGFDLKVMKAGGLPTIRMLRAGYLLTARLMEFPRPVVTACTGHCFAMGVFMMLSTDHIVGSRGDFRISANEVALGLTMPRVAATALRQRLPPSEYQRAVNLSASYEPEAAMAAGFFDELAAPDEVVAAAMARAREYADLDPRAHAATKRRIRRHAIASVKRDVYRDLFDAVMYAVRGSKPKSRI